MIEILVIEIFLCSFVLFVENKSESVKVLSVFCALCSALGWTIPGGMSKSG